MLSTAKPKLKLDIEMALKSDKVAKVFENALLSTFPDISDENGAQDTAEAFGKLCAKEIGLLITPTTLVSPVGPVTGAIQPTEIKVL